jgi:S1-C subfamily serine protease
MATSCTSFRSVLMPFCVSHRRKPTNFLGRNKRRIPLFLLVVTIVTVTAHAQVPHRITKPSSLDNRFEKLSCAVVQIQTGKETGTAFFVSADGDIVTAAHVVYDKKFTVSENGQVGIANTRKPGLKIIRGIGSETEVPIVPLSATDDERAVGDLALLKTGIKSNCFLKIGDSGLLRVGQHLITIGYPNMSPSAALHEGILSGHHRRISPIANPTPNQSIISSDQMLRIQMPIIPGASGSPIISDDDVVVGVAQGQPVQWTNDLDQIVKNFTDAPRSGFSPSGFDAALILGQLAWVVRQYESPGVGLAVPINYLMLEPWKSTTKESRPRRRVQPHR